MFEKEAEKHADGIYHYKINVSDYGEDGIINYRYSDVKEAYQKGAEFGYNKGFEFGVKSNEKVNQIVDNEWHYVKDGDLPKVGVQVLSEKGHLVIYKGDCFCWFEYSPNADNIKLRKWEEPIAWKEIVLPELKESE